jgi:2-hydroxychromene-2-carboxylate isomerase
MQSTLSRAEAPDIEVRLRGNSGEEKAKGTFGAPSFTAASGELFWGDAHLYGIVNKSVASLAVC